jgi:enamine deaminase RidA (YjgF/YER057c/UK114 family)
MTRRSVEVEGLGHGAMPIPAASVVDGLLATGGINGRDPRTGAIPDSIEQEVEQVFRNVVAVVEAAGFGVEDIVKMTFFVRDRASRAWLNGPWTALFPDPASRPARHTLVQELGGSANVQADVLAFRGTDA